MLRYRVVPARTLDAGLAAAWTTLARQDPALASPFFRPGYARTVAQVRDGVEVCVIEDGSTPVGFYPFERLKGGVGQPVGGSMSNFQGLVAAPGTTWTAAELLRHARLETLKFHHQVAGQPEFDAGITRRADSPVIDLSAGWAAYLEALKGAHAGSLSALQRKMRKMERELGRLRFVPHAPTPEVLARLVEWKRAQLARTGSRGSLSHEWGVQVIERLNVVADEDFAGIMSALYAGDRLVAVHAGIRKAARRLEPGPLRDRLAGSR